VAETQPTVGPSRGPVYPVGLLLGGVRCLVVGGGRLAGQKAVGLLRAGAAVTLLAPRSEEAMEAITSVLGRPGPGRPGPIGESGGTLCLLPRHYRPGEAATYRLVLAASGRPEVDRAVADDARRAGIWVNAADDPARCSFFLPSVHRDGPVTVAVATDGRSPALAAWLRRRLAALAGEGLGPLAEVLGEARARLRAEGQPTDSVDWAALLAGPALALAAAGRLDELRQLVAEAPRRPPDARPVSEEWSRRRPPGSTSATPGAGLRPRVGL